MYNIKYLLALAKYHLSGRNSEILNKYYRKYGMKIGEGTHIYSNIMTTEPYLISIGNNVTISDHVAFITHDNSISKVIPGTSDLFGKIVVGDNCFIGARSVLMYGIELAPNIVVASGSVVTKSFQESNIIIGGNPARKIEMWSDFAQKAMPYAFNNILGLSKEEKRMALSNDNKLIVR